MSNPTDRWARIAACFDDLVELAPMERETRLAQIARDDEGAAIEVRALLDADASEDGLLDAGIAAAVPSLPTGADAAAPDDGRAGPYRLLHAIGEGGMGAVFLAERSDGSYEQRVAVKLIKRGMDSVAIVRRFVRERRILARLAHRNIVRLLDGGISSDGRPFYVMEHVDGVPVTQFANDRKLGVIARAGLLVKVVDAVAYAHAQLVVHRDLKPSNVLVDGSGEPRVLDFGIAKLIEESGDQTRTGTAARVLSPAYAAPEQVLGQTITTATDVYALGLMLCELLVGHLPQMRRATSLAQLANEARHETTERVSTLASRLSPARVAELYGVELGARDLNRALAGDLDVIVACALQRDPARRYPTAAAFADDLRRWIDGRPIDALADSATYRMRKFVGRHRLGMAAAVLVALSLVGGLGAALWQARIAQLQAQRADDERVHAERQLARAERVKDFILTLFREQDPVSRVQAKARSASQLIGEGIAQVDTLLEREPDLKAELLRDLGEIQVNLDDRKAGEATLERAWKLQTALTGENSVAAAGALAAYGDAVYAAGDVDKAATMIGDAVRRLRDAGAADAVRTAQAESTLATINLIRAHYEDAERLARHSIDVYRSHYGAASLEVVPRLLTLGKIQHELGQFPGALATLHEALGIVTAAGGSEHARAALLHTSIADTLRVQRKYDEALPEYELALKIERAQLPHGHSIIGGTLIRLGDLQRRTGRFDAADRSLAEAIGILSKAPTGQYAQALQFHGNLARAQGRLELAAERYLASVEAFRTATGDSVYVWLTQLEAVSVLTELGQLARAEALSTDASAAMARTSKEGSYEAAYLGSVVGDLRYAQARYAEAVKLQRATLQVLVGIYEENHAEVAQARASLAASLNATRDENARREAAQLLETALVSLERGGDDSSGPILGFVYLQRSRLRRDTGDLPGARTDIVEALNRLQSPEHSTKLRHARALAKELDVQA